MPIVGLCSRCQSPLPATLPDGACPVCGSRLPSDTPQGEHTSAELVILSPAAEALTASFDLAAYPTQLADNSVPTLPDDIPIPTLSNYEGLTIIGIGGMGMVYRAVQRKTDRVVAVKFLHGGGALDPSLRARFDTEARALARIHHPHIVQVYEVGNEAGWPYFSMEFVPGGTLARQLRAGPFTPRDAVRLIAGVAAAVEAAHREQVLHRDIKPANILLDADGTPKITDFGLAKLADRDDALTLSGHILGTPSYMAPEQAAGRAKEIGPRTDVYGLGATLYELLCGQPPFKGESHAATLQQVQAAEVVPPSRIRAGVPAEVEAICLKCLAKTPAKRYPTAQEVADDLNRWCAGEPTRARPLTGWGQTRRWICRHRVTVALALLLLAVLIGVQLGRKPSPRDAINRELNTDQPVNLLTETGMPRWHEWLLGAATLEKYPGGTFGFQTLNPSLLALAHAPDKPYRLVVTLRHVSGIRNADEEDSNLSGGHVGVFWNYDSWSIGANQQAHRFLVAEYNDFPLSGWRPGKPLRQRLYVRAYVLNQEPTRSDRGARDQLLTQFEFTPMQKPPGEWRQLVVEVRPSVTTIRWGHPTGELVDVGTFATRLLAKVDDQVLQPGIAPTKGEAIPTPPPVEAFAGRRLGIWAQSATVEIQEFRIEPLTDSPSP